MLREDNADLRLTEIGRQLGLVDDARWRYFNEKREAIATESQRLKTTWVRVGTEQTKQLQNILNQEINREYNLLDILRRPEIDYQRLMSVDGLGEAVTDPAVAEQVEIQAKYQGYIDRQATDIERVRRNEELSIPTTFDYQGISGLSTEVKQKLMSVRPATIGQAMRISGITPAAISMLLVYLKKADYLQNKQSA